MVEREVIIYHTMGSFSSSSQHCNLPMEALVNTGREVPNEYSRTWENVQCDIRTWYRIGR